MEAYQTAAVVWRRPSHDRHPKLLNEYNKVRCIHYSDGVASLKLPRLPEALCSGFIPRYFLATSLPGRLRIEVIGVTGCESVRTVYSVFDHMGLRP